MTTCRYMGAFDAAIATYYALNNVGAYSTDMGAFDALKGDTAYGTHHVRRKAPRDRKSVV